MRSSFTTRQSRDGSIPAADSIARRSRRLILPGLLTLAALVLLVSLGNWQVRRLVWKEALIEQASENRLKPPLDWRNEDQRNLAYDSFFTHDFNYHPIRLDGEYLTSKEARVFTSLPAEDARGPASGPGYLIMTPLELADANYAVWVNRGFVPEGAIWAPAPAGLVTIIGLVRPDDPPGWLTPAAELDKNLFFSRSIQVLSEAKQIPPRGAPMEGFTVDLLPTPGGPSLPQAGETRMRFANNHLQYAITWYGLAAVLLAVFSVFGWQTLRRSDEKQP